MRGVGFGLWKITLLGVLGGSRSEVFHGIIIIIRGRFSNRWLAWLLGLHINAWSFCTHGCVDRYRVGQFPEFALERFEATQGRFYLTFRIAEKGGGSPGPVAILTSLTRSLDYSHSECYHGLLVL